MEILEIFKWPITLIIIALIFRSPVKQLIERVKSIKGVGFGFDTIGSKSKEEQQRESKELQLGKLENELSLFSEQTREHFQLAIKQESEWDKADGEKAKIEILLNYSEALYIILFFERIYNLIFGTQIQTLKHLNSSNGETLNFLEEVYKDTIQENEEFLKDYPFEHYWGFLESRGLVTIEGDQAKITWLGRDFLKYIVEKGLTDQKYN